MSITPKNLLIHGFIVSLLFILTGCNSAQETSGSAILHHLKNEPNVYCTVLAQPDPGLYGHWIGQNSYTKAEAWFGEINGKYAFFYKWQSKNSSRGNAKWRPNIVNGKEITNPEGVMKFWVKNGVFYSQFKNEPITAYVKYEG